SRLFTATAPPDFYTLSLHDALPIFAHRALGQPERRGDGRSRLPLGRQAQDAAFAVGERVLLAPGLHGQVGVDGAAAGHDAAQGRSEEHTSELQSRENLVCRLLLEKK